MRSAIHDFNERGLDALKLLQWTCHRLQQRGKEALLVIWNNASWHKSHQVRYWITAHNRQVKDSGRGIRIVP